MALTNWRKLRLPKTHDMYMQDYASTNYRVNSIIICGSNHVYSVHMYSVTDRAWRSCGDEGPQSGSRSGSSTGQSVTPRTGSGSAIPGCNTASNLGWRQNKPHGRKQSHNRSPAARMHTDSTLAPPNSQQHRDWTSHAARGRDRTEGGSGRAPSKHGGAAHALIGHERDAETRPCTRARPGKSSV